MDKRLAMRRMPRAHCKCGRLLPRFKTGAIWPHVCWKTIKPNTMAVGPAGGEAR